MTREEGFAYADMLPAAGTTIHRLLGHQDEAGMMWGDVGRLYYWIKHEDLKAARWELSWLILQCC
jgi:uncharacterized protein YwqG